MARKCKSRLARPPAEQIRAIDSWRRARSRRARHHRRSRESAVSVAGVVLDARAMASASARPAPPSPLRARRPRRSSARARSGTSASTTASTDSDAATSRDDAAPSRRAISMARARRALRARRGPGARDEARRLPPRLRRGHVPLRRAARDLPDATTCVWRSTSSARATRGPRPGRASTGSRTRRRRGATRSSTSSSASCAKRRRRTTPPRNPPARASPGTPSEASSPRTSPPGPALVKGLILMNATPFWAAVPPRDGDEDEHEHASSPRPSLVPWRGQLPAPRWIQAPFRWYWDSFRSRGTSGVCYRSCTRDPPPSTRLLRDIVAPTNRPTRSPFCSVVWSPKPDEASTGPRPPRPKRRVSTHSGQSGVRQGRSLGGAAVGAAAEARGAARAGITNQAASDTAPRTRARRRNDVVAGWVEWAEGADAGGRSGAARGVECGVAGWWTARRKRLRETRRVGDEGGMRTRRRFI